VCVCVCVLTSLAQIIAAAYTCNPAWGSGGPGVSPGHSLFLGNFPVKNYSLSEKPPPRWRTFFCECLRISSWASQRTNCLLFVFVLVMRRTRCNWCGACLITPSSVGVSKLCVLHATVRVLIHRRVVDNCYSCSRLCVTGDTWLLSQCSLYCGETWPCTMLAYSFVQRDVHYRNIKNSEDSAKCWRILSCSGFIPNGKTCCIICKNFERYSMFFSTCM